ncbi:MAG TPA: hypothetical protein VEA19_04560 [Actinomycetota bacterium]|nr:hypothetical protein [Actinomycetota bacterium]
MEFELELKLDSPLSFALGLVAGLAIGLFLGSPERRERVAAHVRQLRPAAASR